ncbi:GIY-YIG nuclease family protein [Kitasatospora sp. NPDC004745]|uniref:GIY-YIG nuclease family protein n=1 Tax=Kitasatospora sp. NPDC004745 TaxID=3364019 RepID=UPI0036B70108
MAPLSESQYAARLAQCEIDPEELLGLLEEEQVRTVLLDRLRTEGTNRESGEVANLVHFVEWLALRRLGPAAERPQIPGTDQLYVLSFARATSSYVKVGRTTRFGAGRLRELRAEAERGGYVLLEAWVSELVADAHPWEHVVLGELRRRHPGESRGEYFYGLDFDDARSVVDQQRCLVAPRSFGLTDSSRRPA